MERPPSPPRGEGGVRGSQAAASLTAISSTAAAPAIRATESSMPPRERRPWSRWRPLPRERRRVPRTIGDPRRERTEHGDDRVVRERAECDDPPDGECAAEDHPHGHEGEEVPDGRLRKGVQPEQRLRQDVLDEPADRPRENGPAEASPSARRSPSRRAASRPATRRDREIPRRRTREPSPRPGSGRSARSSPASTRPFRQLSRGKGRENQHVGQARERRRRSDSDFEKEVSATRDRLDASDRDAAGIDSIDARGLDEIPRPHPRGRGDVVQEERSAAVSADDPELARSDESRRRGGRGVDQELCPRERAARRDDATDETVGNRERRALADAGRGTDPDERALDTRPAFEQKDRGASHDDREEREPPREAGARSASAALPRGAGRARSPASGGRSAAARSPFAP